MSALISQTLLQKYNVSGPRYTSYPTAIQFGTDVCSGEYRSWLAKARQKDKPLSIYVHVPFCKSLCYYCGCHKVITRSGVRTQAYLQSLLHEIEMQSSWLRSNRPVTQIHFGGGTPTFYKTDELVQLLEAIHGAFNTQMPEISIEIDPRTTTVDDIKNLAQAGVNRLSFGIQDFDDQVQAAINRIQCEEQTRSLIEVARKYGVESISVDLVYGLPHQTIKRFEKTLGWVRRIKPDRIALYSYAHMPQLIKAQRVIDETALPSPDDKLKLFSAAANEFVTMGYQQIGMDHFALPTDSLSEAYVNNNLHRNFMGYSTQSECDMIGVGASAISKIGSNFSQNIKNVKQYIAAINNEIPAIERGYNSTIEDQIRAEVIEQIMCRQEVCFEDIERRFDITFAEYFADELARLKPLVNDHLVSIEPKRLKLLPAGRVLVRNIAMVFDAYLTHQETERIRFSKAI